MPSQPDQRSDEPSTALVYDFMLVPGGAEQLSLHVLERHPAWRLVAGAAQTDAFEHTPVPWQRVDVLGRRVAHPALQALATLRAFERRGALLTNFERVLFSGVYAPVGVMHRPGRHNVYYCHTPPRFAYDLEDWYLERASAWQRPALRRLAAHVRDRYEWALGQMQRIAANSHNVADRLHRYLGVEDVRVIHPPVDTETWRWIEAGDYYLSNARLEPYKRVEWAVRAFMEMPDRKLVVASGGSQLGALRELADGCANIRFTGWTSPGELRELVGRCIATVYLARDEDFGMAPVESMAAGKPVIGVDEGGLRETVVHGETGWLVDPGNGESVESLVDAVQHLDDRRALAMRQACERRAQDFRSEVFDAALDRFVAGAP